MEGVERPRAQQAHGYSNSNVIKGGGITGSTPAGFAQIGSGDFTGQSMSSVTSGPAADGSEGYTLNLVDAPVASAAKKILGDIMGYNYLVDPRVTGTVTLQTSNPMSKQSLLDILESIAGGQWRGDRQRRRTGTRSFPFPRQRHRTRSSAAGACRRTSQA